MNRSIASLLLFCALPFFAPSVASAVTIQWAPVGDAGNLADTVIMATDGTTGYGSVAYNYRIGIYDVTNAQYAEFLNTKDPGGANTLGLYNAKMANSTIGGITVNGSNPSGSKFVLTAGRENHPVAYVSWYDSVRFANWLNNGQGSGDTETGAYTLGPLGAGGVPIDGLSITRNAGATVFLPSENEWYKAAYYDPHTSSYFQYATSSNTAPIASSPTGLPNHANYNFVGNSTEVGAYTGTTSPYGAYDMNGNTNQWNEGVFRGRFRGLRGGAFDVDSHALVSAWRNAYDPTTPLGVVARPAAIDRIADRIFAATREWVHVIEVRPIEVRRAARLVNR